MTRVSTRSLSDSVVTAILGAQQRVLQLQLNLADGRRLRVPSDDPLGARLALSSRERLRATEQYRRNLDHAVSNLSTADQVLFQIEDAIASVRSLQAVGSSDNLGLEGRRALAQQVDETLTTLLELGNEQFSGVYLFAGTQSLLPPLEAERDSEGRLLAVTAPRAESEKPILRQVDRDVLLRIRLPVTDVFGDGLELFAEMIALRDALEANDGDQIRSFGPGLLAVEDRAIAAHSGAGALLQRAEALRQRLEQDELSHEADRSRAEDLEVARAVTELQQNQVALEASLASGSRLINTSLLDYLP